MWSTLSPHKICFGATIRDKSFVSTLIVTCDACSKLWKEFLRYMPAMSETYWRTWLTTFCPSSTDSGVFWYPMASLLYSGSRIISCASLSGHLLWFFPIKSRFQLFLWTGTLAADHRATICLSKLRSVVSVFQSINRLILSLNSKLLLSSSEKASSSLQRPSKGYFGNKNGNNCISVCAMTPSSLNALQFPVWSVIYQPTDPPIHGNLPDIMSTHVRKWRKPLPPMEETSTPNGGNLYLHRLLNPVAALCIKTFPPDASWQDRMDNSKQHGIDNYSKSTLPNNEGNKRLPW